MTDRPKTSIEVDSQDLDLSLLGATKQNLIRLLKKKGMLSLAQVAKELGLTKMGVLKHLDSLETSGLVERVYVKKGVGRPSLHLKLTRRTLNLFPEAYASITCSVLEFIEEKLGSEGVLQALRKRKNDLLPAYERLLKGKAFEEKVKTLAKVRDQEGYMVELNVLTDSFELLEFNCPIFEVADQYWDACTTEKELFTELLGTEVHSTHRVVAGNNVCRFIIAKPKE
ncbi:MAG: transcriptional regulator [Methanobacteriota archaeon]|nr:MAG: transcriptional regulator [Euryarchaeota archaeon]